VNLHNTSSDPALEALIGSGATAMYALAVSHDGCAEQILSGLDLPTLRRLGELADALSSKAFGLAAPRSGRAELFLSDGKRLPVQPAGPPLTGPPLLEVDDLDDLYPDEDETDEADQAEDEG
jgi:hypothetical protein